MGVVGGKDASRARAMELFPDHLALFKRVKDDGRSDASLIALWGYRNG
jgi:crossover junction endodeoxyribonuclease RuvC